VTRRQVYQSTWRLRLLYEGTLTTVEYSPSTTLASGNVASAAGVSGSAWEAGADSSAGGATSSSATAVAGSSPSQDKSVDFLHSTQDGCQSSTTTTSSTTRETQHLQARPDHRHGWGAEDAGDINQSRLGRRFLLHFCDRCLLLRSSGGFRAPLSSRGWRSIRAKSSSTVGAGLRLPAASLTVSHSPSSPCSTGSEGGISCKQGHVIVNI
jgi:hypothetical protein